MNYKASPGENGGKRVYPLSKFRRSNQDTCINHRVRVKEGEKVAITLGFDDGSSKKIEAPIRKPTPMPAAMNHSTHQH